MATPDAQAAKTGKDRPAMARARVPKAKGEEESQGNEHADVEYVGVDIQKEPYICTYTYLHDPILLLQMLNAHTCMCGGATVALPTCTSKALAPRREK